MQIGRISYENRAISGSLLGEGWEASGQPFGVPIWEGILGASFNWPDLPKVDFTSTAGQFGPRKNPDIVKIDRHLGDPFWAWIGVEFESAGEPFWSRFQVFIFGLFLETGGLNI